MGRITKRILIAGGILITAVGGSVIFDYLYPKDYSPTSPMTNAVRVENLVSYDLATDYGSLDSIIAEIAKIKKIDEKDKEEIERDRNESDAQYYEAIEIGRKYGRSGIKEIKKEYELLRKSLELDPSNVKSLMLFWGIINQYHGGVLDGDGKWDPVISNNSAAEICDQFANLNLKTSNAYKTLTGISDEATRIAESYQNNQNK